MKLLVMFALPLFIGNIALGQGHTIGNGGGISELQMTKLWTNAEQEMKFCLDPRDPCEIEREGQDAVANVLINMGKKGEIKFTAAPGNWVYITEDKPQSDVTYNSSQLYEADGAPLAYQALAAYVYEVLFYQNGLAPKPAAATGKKVAQFLYADSHRISSGLGAAKVSLIWRNPNPKYETEFHFFLDLPKYSYELTELFAKNPCDPGLTLSTRMESLSFTTVDNDRIEATGQMKHTCYGEAWTSRVKITLPLKVQSGHQVLNEEKARVRYYDARKTDVIH